MSPTRINKEEKRNDLTAAAARVFAKKGFFGTVMADIALEAGIGKGTIYEYFDSKEELFFAVFEWVFLEFGAQAKINISAITGSVSERLMALNSELMRAWVDMEDMFVLVMEFWAASASSRKRDRFKQAFRVGYNDFRAIVSDLIRVGMQSGEFRPDVESDHLAAAVVGAWDALLLQAWFDQEFDLLATSESFLSVLLDGMAAGRENAGRGHKES